jgi:hypothetical protein
MADPFLNHAGSPVSSDPAVINVTSDHAVSSTCWHQGNPYS